MICLLLVLMLLPLPSQAQQAEAPAPTLRVLLRRLNLTDRADLTLEGRYSIQTDAPMAAFPSGAKVTVQIRDGSLYLFYAGMSLRLGNTITFLRHGDAAGTGGGIRFASNCILATCPSPRRTDSCSRSWPCPWKIISRASSPTK